jgi:hypothetical protein
MLEELVGSLHRYAGSISIVVYGLRCVFRVLECVCVCMCVYVCVCDMVCVYALVMQRVCTSPVPPCVHPCVCLSTPVCLSCVKLCDMHTNAAQLSTLTHACMLHTPTPTPTPTHIHARVHTQTEQPSQTSDPDVGERSPDRHRVLLFCFRAVVQGACVVGRRCGGVCS